MKTKTLSNPEKIYFFKNGKNIGISKNKIELNKRYCDKNIRKGNTKIKVENKELRNKIKQRIGYKCNEEKKTCARSERTLNNADTYIKIKNTAEEGIQIRYSYQSSSSKKLACNIINKIKEDTSKNWFLPTKDQELKYSQAENKILINSGFKNEKTLQLLQEILI